MSGIRVIRVLRKACAAMKILVLSTYDDASYVHGAMQAEADGYVLKCVEVAELVRIIKSFCVGREVVSPYLVNLAVETQSPEGTNAEPRDERETDDAVLTHREQEILRALVQGRSDKEISHRCPFQSVAWEQSHRGQPRFPATDLGGGFGCHRV